MQPRRSVASLVILVVALGAAGACGQSPLAPTSGDRTREESALPPLAIEITGAESVVPGESAQLSATAKFSDGPRDVTRDVLWSTSNAAVMTISPAGRVSAHGRGEATIRAVLRGVEASRTTFALPTGTYRLSGSVSLGGVAVGGALVEVMSGAGSGLSATTEGGQYRIYGVAGDTRVQVTNPECEVESRMIDINWHETLDFELRSIPRPQAGGSVR